MKSLVIVVLSLTSLLALVGPAAAQGQANKEPVAGAERRTVIDMDGDVIEGTLAAPDTLIIREPIRLKFRSLIQVRSDFRREILASGAQL